MKTKLIISVDRPNLSQTKLYTNRLDFEYLLTRLNLAYDVCEGSWQGQREQSYMIALDDSKHYARLLDVAFSRFHQDAVLKVSAYGGAVLINNNMTKQAIGKLVETNVIPLDKCYTQRYSDGAVFITVDHK